MNKNPFLNAILAGLYIVTIVFVMDTIMSSTKEGTGDEMLLIPMTMLSLLVLSTAVMGFLFVLEPLRLFLDGHRQEAITFF